MQYIPHKYQEYCTSFIVEHPEAAIFLDMGLGKTVLTLTAVQRLLAEGTVRRVLVVAPLRVARDTWPAELEKWDHLKGLRCAVAVGTEKQRRAALEQDAPITMINREAVPWLVSNSGFPFCFDMVVIDELSSFKSGTARRFRALNRVRPTVKRVVGLSGTPSPNSLLDLWSEFRLIDGGKRLGFYYGSYRSRYFLPDRGNGNIVYSWRIKPGAEQVIYSQLRDITISMKAEDHLQMPELIRSNVCVRMSPGETELYQEMRQQLALELDGEIIDAKNAAVLAGKLGQLASGACYDADHVVRTLHERKLDALEDLIEAANGKPLLVAYWYQHDLQRIMERLKGQKLRVEVLDSPDSFVRWNRREIDVGLIHPASCGHGLNLQAGGNTLVWFSQIYSCELYQQTCARLYRQGQTASTVVIQHIVCEGTIDEHALDILQKKEKGQDALIQAVKAELASCRNSRKHILNKETETGPASCRSSRKHILSTETETEPASCRTGGTGFQKRKTETEVA